MLDRWIEKDLLRTLKDTSVGCITFSPLAQGMLTDRYLNGIPKDSRAAKSLTYLNTEEVKANIEKVKQLHEIAKKRNQSLSQMAIAWILRHDQVSSVLIGASSPEQLENLPDVGIQSVLCLRCTHESGFRQEERSHLETLGIQYQHIPISPDTLSGELITQGLQTIDHLPKPILIGCRSAFRAGFIALLYLATRHHLSKRETYSLQQNLGFDFSVKPPFQQWFDHYMNQSPSH